MRLVATDVTLQYGRLRVLDGASLSVRTGRSVAVLGPSGSGKSTLLAVLGGMIEPLSGTVAATGDDGTPVTTPRPRLCSWILQTMNVLPERSVADNVAVAALARGLARRPALAVAGDQLGLVGLADRASEQVRVLSGGEVQRVVIARALAGGRPFLLADEPTGQLDRRTSDTVLTAMFTAVRDSRNVGLVVVTHDPSVADRCDQIAHLADGKVVLS